MTLGKRITAIIFALLASIPVFADIFVRGDGKVTESIRKVSGFDALDVSGVAQITVSEGKDYSVIVETDSNLQSVFETKVKGNVLVLGFKPGTSISHVTKLNVAITMPKLSAVSISGTSAITLADKFSGGSLGVDISGNGEFSGALDYKNVALDGSGSSSFNISGKAEKIVAGISGAANINAKSFSVAKAVIDISGVGSVRIAVSETLEVSISGAGSVTYYGNPKNIKQDISGVGSIKQGS